MFKGLGCIGWQTVVTPTIQKTVTTVGSDLTDHTTDIHWRLILVLGNLAIYKKQ